MQDAGRLYAGERENALRHERYTSLAQPGEVDPKTAREKTVESRHRGPRNGVIRREESQSPVPDTRLLPGAREICFRKKPNIPVARESSRVWQQAVLSFRPTEATSATRDLSTMARRLHIHRIIRDGSVSDTNERVEMTSIANPQFVDRYYVFPRPLCLEYHAAYRQEAEEGGLSA